MGSSMHGQLGNPNPQSEDKSIAIVEGKIKGEFVKQISSGTYHTAVMTSRGRVYTWGKGANGQLGLGDTDDRNCPTLVEALRDWQVELLLVDLVSQLQFATVNLSFLVINHLAMVVKQSLGLRERSVDGSVACPAHFTTSSGENSVMCMTQSRKESSSASPVLDVMVPYVKNMQIGLSESDQMLSEEIQQLRAEVIAPPQISLSNNFQ
ncbi:hypothetical protein GIB67_037336 [Kingdonia uniflora]|uniref:Uncharacterized protein n=1 Tax=Kingdonia uniflora TaxID=39325 RepID=A0A7J7LFZ5_9MAGN|nr:hypothetical protein GIB67_037336 [Kingdonia uniflora]